MNHARINSILAEAAKGYHDSTCSIANLESVNLAMQDCHLGASSGRVDIRESFVRMLSLTLRAVELVETERETRETERPRPLPPCFPRPRR